ncbi:MAG TPA: hypothetical protein VK943_14105, partial [Arenibaculum sp.]|nr:hypothetical protein [Arenibaculum sp.]
GEPADGALSWRFEVAPYRWASGDRLVGLVSVDPAIVERADGGIEGRQTYASAGGWNAVKNMSFYADGDAAVTLGNFVHVDVDTSGHRGHYRDADRHGSTVVVDGAKRGNISTGEDNDSVWIRPLSNGSTWGNEFRIATGDGSDTIRIHTAAHEAAHLFNGRPLVGDGSLTTVRIDAGSGNDILHLGGAREIVDGGAGDRDTVIYDAATEGVIAFLNEVGVVTPLVGQGGAAGDVLVGVERLKGSRHDDVLHGNSGDNDLIGGLGDDVLTGGDGHDHFVLAPGYGPGYGMDTVSDFKLGEDTVEVRGVHPAHIHQEVMNIHGTDGLLIRLSHRPEYGVSTMFLEGITTDLAVDLHAGTEANWHDGIMLS